MLQSRAPGPKSLTAFRVLALASSLAALAQITLGGVVRVSGSGLGCPDWPLCHGQIIPPFEFATLIEYSHRLSASALSFLVLATLILAWLFLRNNRWALWPAAAGMGLVIVAAALGGATVLTELRWWVRLIHLAVAEGVVACMVIAAVAGWRVSSLDAAVDDKKYTVGYRRHLYATLAAVFLLILSGSYIVGYGAGSSCSTWPLCQGRLFPEGGAFAIHMGHRYIAAIVGLMVVGAAAMAWKQRHASRAMGVAGVALAGLFVLQTMAGAATVWAGFTPEMKAAHLSLATLVWMSLVLTTALVAVPIWSESEQHAPSMSSASPLEGAT